MRSVAVPCGPTKLSPKPSKLTIKTGAVLIPNKVCSTAAPLGIINGLSATKGFDSSCFTAALLFNLSKEGVCCAEATKENIMA